jgi:hypothetical protein
MVTEEHVAVAVVLIALGSVAYLLLSALVDLARYLLNELRWYVIRLMYRRRAMTPPVKPQDGD